MTFEPGQTIDDRYLVKQRLGGNVHGSTCKANTISGNREVVLKKLNRDSDQGMQQQLHLAQQAQQLSRQCDEILTIDEVSVEEDHVFYVLPFLPLRSLKRHRLPPEDSEADNQEPRYFAEDFAWLDRVAKALDFLSSGNYIHGDVKPTNILFREDERGRPTAYLSDMEIAKPPSTVAGKNKEEYPGTMAYLAREVFLDKEKASHYSDQFALGVTLYQWLSGELPFKGLNGIEMYKAFKKGCQPISELCPELPLSACEAIHRSLSDEPEQRFRSSVDFATAFVGGLPVRVKKSSLVSKLEMASTVFMLVAATTLLIVSGGRYFFPADTENVSENGMQLIERTGKPKFPSEQLREGSQSNFEGMATVGSTATPPRKRFQPEGMPPQKAEPKGPEDIGQSEAQHRFVFRPMQTPEQYLHSALVAASQPSATAAAQFRLAQMYEKGIGGEVHMNQAFAWYQKAAFQGHPEASLRVADFYESIGQIDGARQWRQKAKKQLLELQKRNDHTHHSNRQHGGNATPIINRSPTAHER